MRKHLVRLLLCISIAARGTVVASQEPPSDDLIRTALTNNQRDLGAEGLKFLLDEADNRDFLLLGELHGDNEIPRLLNRLWPAMWKQGYRHIAAEVSPWAANQLEFVPAGKGPEILGLWTKQQANDVRIFADSSKSVLWGCDIEEAQPQRLIAQIALLNATDPDLRRMVEMTEGGYNRTMAPHLLDLMRKTKATSDKKLNDLSLHESLLETLEVETNRLSADTKLIAQDERERLMKKQFLQHYRHASLTGMPSKVLLCFGRNHLHRGYDARGVSTLGNFIAEFALSEGKSAFNVGAFGAGGKEALAGNTWNADERQDELAFALLAEIAEYSATIFDLRPLRAMLHRTAQENRSALQVNLIYWADSYDALICFKTVTPLERQTQSETSMN
jgi:hypothetical protein